MIWTKDDTQIHASMTAAGTAIIDRRVNTVRVRLSMEEAVGLIREIAQNFGVEGVPSVASYSEIELVIENPVGFHPKDMD